jgi:selenide, water dikinase
MEPVKLTRYCPWGDCGSRLDMHELGAILDTLEPVVDFPELLSGAYTREDSLVFHVGKGQALISASEFFTPVSDDAREFGKIVAVSALSKVYGMGGRPIAAVSVMGWPMKELPLALAGDMIRGAREACFSAGIPLASGHSLALSHPLLGLTVTGLVGIDQLKLGNTAAAGCRLFIAKPLGSGLLLAAKNQGILDAKHEVILDKWLSLVSQPGEELGKIKDVKAMVTIGSSGLAGHVLEMCEKSGVNAVLQYNILPVIEGWDKYKDKGILPDGTKRNLERYGHALGELTWEQQCLLADPQYSGALLVAVIPGGAPKFLERVRKLGIDIFEIGYLSERKGDDLPFITVK